MNHTQNLLQNIPDLLSRRILDLGCGRGGTILQFLDAGAKNVVGIDTNRQQLDAARAKGITTPLFEGPGEYLPFKDRQFGFVNMGEVIEHVQDPVQVMSEVWRVLDSGGCAYISVPNRFGFFDPHFHLAFVNWMPRRWSDAIVDWLGRHKESGVAGGNMSLSGMHYMTHWEFLAFASDMGFYRIKDTKIEKLRRIVPYGLKRIAMAAYLCYGVLFIQTFHFIVYKRETTV